MEYRQTCGLQLRRIINANVIAKRFGRHQSPLFGLDPTLAMTDTAFNFAGTMTILAL